MKESCNYLKLAFRIVVWILLVMTIVSGIVVVVDLVRIYQEEKFWEDVRELKETGYVLDKELAFDDILPEYQELYKRNQDTVGWLKIGGARIDTPIMQTRENPEYYLRRNFDKEDYSGGTPFIDYRCSVFPRRSFNLILYGHYTNGDRLFRRILDYASETWALKHKEFQFDTLEEKGIYEVVAAFYYDGTDIVLNAPEMNDGEQAYAFYNYIELDSEEGFEQYVQNIVELNLYKGVIEITKEDKILTIVCCAPKEFSGIEEEGRFVLIAKKVQK